MNIDEKEFVHWLEIIVDYGIEPTYHFTSIDHEQIPDKYQQIFEVLNVVGKIGGGSIQAGITRLTEDEKYKPNLKALNPSGWGKNPVGNRKKTIGEMLAIVELVKHEQSKHKYKSKACDAVDVKYHNYSKYNRAVKIYFKALLESKMIKNKDDAVKLHKYILLNSYNNILKNKIFTGEDLNDLEINLNLFFLDAVYLKSVDEFTISKKEK